METFPHGMVQSGSEHRSYMVASNKLGVFDDRKYVRIKEGTKAGIVFGAK